TRCPDQYPARWPATWPATVSPQVDAPSVLSSPLPTSRPPGHGAWVLRVFLSWHSTVHTPRPVQTPWGREGSDEGSRTLSRRDPPGARPAGWAPAGEGAGSQTQS